MGFRKGGEAAQKAAESAGGARFARVEYLKIEDDSQVALRYLTDSPDWLFVDQHAGAPTKNKPSDWDDSKGKWPDSMPAVCRYDSAFEGQFSDCYICDAGLVNNWGRPCKPSVRVWALACLREEVIGTPELVAAGKCTEDKIGKRIGFRDATRKVAEVNEKGEPTGNEIDQRALVVVNFAPNNYFNALQASYSIYGTVCDRDFIVKKTGKGKDVEYTNIALDQTPNLMPGSESWARYDEAIKEQNLSLEAIVTDRASDDFYARFFDPNKTPAKKEGEKSTSSPAEAPKAQVPASADDEVDQARLAEMRARVRGNAPAAAGVAAGDID